MQLPEAFSERMAQQLPPEEYQDFINSYNRTQYHALRVNPLKISRDEFLAKAPFTLEPVPWASNGFYYPEEERPGKHPYHEAGLYYIQEPSAMSVAELAGVKPGDRVLDLCAAPGGKTTQLAGFLMGKGLLVANEIHPVRAKILSQNVERMGICNALVTNETPGRLKSRFPGFFDCIVVDAPCSGEGMFYKEEQALVHWSPENVAMCGERQDEILEAAAAMLAPGGTLVYSTCTFAPTENEGSVSRFLEKQPEFHVKSVKACELFAPGHPEWVGGPRQVEGTFRLWPHRLKGEGHYLAVLKKEGERISLPRGKDQISPYKNGKGPAIDRKNISLWEEFAKENLKMVPEGNLTLFGDQLYRMPENISLKGLKVLRPGLHLGTCLKNRLEPSHALALALTKSQAARSCSLDPEQAVRYLKGETLPCSGPGGWTLVLVDGYSLGWGKVNGGVLKNHYPKGLRLI